MNMNHTLAAFALLATASACVPSGYYDSNGEYRSYGAADSYRHNNAMAGTAPEGTYYAPASGGTTTVVTYSRAGYYDYQGDYIAAENAPNVPQGFFPPRGMCRIWLNDNRPASAEPPVESCAGIRERVPSGAYVVYGG